MTSSAPSPRTKSSFAGAGCGHDMGAARLGDLHGEMADAAGRGMDQRALSLLQAADLDEALPGGEAGQRQRACLHMVEAVRLA